MPFWHPLFSAKLAHLFLGAKMACFNSMQIDANSRLTQALKRCRQTGIENTRLSQIVLESRVAFIRESQPVVLSAPHGMPLAAPFK
jgi:hypothetical protein